MFASRLSHQLPKFVSWFPEPGAYKNDAFSFSWSCYSPYLFPPFSLIGKVINKIIEDEVKRAVMIIPFWKSQSWFPLVMDLLISIPVRLPRHKDILTLPYNGQVHPLCRSLTLIAVELSADISRVRDFYQKLHPSFCSHGRRGQGNSMPWLGTNGLFGVNRKVKIPLKRLRLR